jgi:hypothetical protein
MRLFFTPPETITSGRQRQQQLSEVIVDQLTLSFEPDLKDRHRNLLDCMAACIYQRGLKTIAADLEKAPGNLSRELGGDSDRHFSVESLERYIQVTGDTTPIKYLIARYMGDQARTEAETMSRVHDMLGQMALMVGQIRATPKRGRSNG